MGHSCSKTPRTLFAAVLSGCPSAPTPAFVSPSAALGPDAGDNHRLAPAAAGREAGGGDGAAPRRSVQPAVPEGG